MFSFFGAFTDATPGLAEQFRQRWPDIDLVSIRRPFCGFAARFQESVYSPSQEDLPESVSNEVQEISLRFSDARIVLLRTECWGGDCSNWGQFIRNGQVVTNEPLTEIKENKGVLRRLMSNFDVDIGSPEIFEPLSRSFPWKTGR